jgi:glycosyltransferase involved in cell wall biosynthesis
VRICVNALSIEPGITGGGETFLVNLMQRLCRNDKSNQYLILVAANNRHLFETIQPPPRCLTIIHSSKARLLRILFENLILPFYLLTRRVDLYYSPFGTLPFFLFCKSVVTIQNLIYFDFTNNVPYRGRSWRSRLVVALQGLYFKLLIPHALKKADGVWAVSETTAANLEERFGIKRDKIDMIYEGVDFEEFNPSRCSDPRTPQLQPPYIVTVATMYPNKNIDKLIVAFSALVAKGFPHRLVIIGPDWLGYQDVLQQHVEILNLAEKVIFTGAIAHSQLPEYLWGADLFVLMSTVESFGLPVVEAMAAGVPVIVSNTSSLQEIAGDAALTAPPQKPSRLATEMIRVLSDRALARQMRERGINRARSFNWTETAARTIDLFNRVGGRGVSRKEYA